MTSEEEEELDIENISNGFLFSNIFFPEEILINILIFVDWKDLLSCRAVCHNWKRIIDSVVCFEKLRMFHYQTLCSSFTLPISKLKLEGIPFYLFYSISKGCFGKNLLQNPFGSGDDPHVCHNRLSWRDILPGSQDNNRILCSDRDCPRFKYWKVITTSGDGWKVEKEPVGSEPLPAHLEGRSCFVTSYAWCEKEQVISLSEWGLSPKIMDDIQPDITVSEWYAKRHDCGVNYRLTVCLLDINQEPIKIFQAEAGHHYVDNSWHEQAGQLSPVSTNL